MNEIKKRQLKEKINIIYTYCKLYRFDLKRDNQDIINIVKESFQIYCINIYFFENKLYKKYCKVRSNYYRMWQGGKNGLYNNI